MLTQALLAGGLDSPRSTANDTPGQLKSDLRHALQAAQTLASGRQRPFSCRHAEAQMWATNFKGQKKNTSNSEKVFSVCMMLRPKSKFYKMLRLRTYPS